MRLRVPDEGETVFHDQIRGEIATSNQAIDDFVIRRSDGARSTTSPSRSTTATWASPRSCAARPHLEHPAPGDDPARARRGAARYAHLPLLHGPDGKKLSKRHGAASVQELRDAGYLPEAVRNYIALLGWGYDESTTFFTTDELIEHFDLSRVSKQPAVFDEQKLRWMNGRYLRELPVEELKAPRAAHRPRAADRGVAISQDKLQTLADFWPLAGFLVERRDFDEQAWAR